MRTEAGNPSKKGLPDRSPDDPAHAAKPDQHWGAAAAELRFISENFRRGLNDSSAPSKRSTIEMLVPQEVEKQIGASPQWQPEGRGGVVENWYLDVFVNLPARCAQCLLLLTMVAPIPCREAALRDLAGGGLLRPPPR